MFHIIICNIINHHSTLHLKMITGK